MAQRKLAAILHADVVGYSLHMGEDEEATLRTLGSHREAIAALVRQHQGEVVDMAGDSLLAEFPSVVEAVQSAVKMQKIIKSLNEPLPNNHKLQFRIGVNLGDVIFDNKTIYGDGVNVAARLQALADPGGICVSGAVYDAIGSKLQLAYKPMGEQQVENITRPISAYRLRLEPDRDVNNDAVVPGAPGQKQMSRFIAAGIIVALIATVLLVLPDRVPEKVLIATEAPSLAQDFNNKPSIAVLPFENLGGDPAQEYFANGITDDLITDLTKITGLLVIARDSTFAHKGEPLDIHQLSRKLNVRYVLVGSVRREEDLVRINAQLVDATTGNHLWADRYDGETNKIFELQDKITQEIVSALAIKLSIEDRQRITGPDTNNIKAYDYFLQGREHFFYYSKDETREAQRFYQKAIELDPDYARAIAMLAWTYWFEYVNGWSDDPEHSLQIAATQAEKAIALNDSLPVAYFVTGLVHREKKEYVKALVEAEKAIAVDPNYANGHVLLATLLYYAGRPEEGLQQIEKAIRLHPYHPHNYPFHKGQAYYILKRYSEAISTFKQGLESHPNSERLHLWLAAAYAQSGQIDDAEWEADQVLMLNPDFSMEQIKKVFPFKNPDDLEHFLSGLRKAGLPT